MIKAKVNFLNTIIESKVGHWFIGILIVLSAMILGAETFQEISPSFKSKLQTINQGISLIFILELIIRISTKGRSFFERGWNIFDFFIIIGSVIPHQQIIVVFRTLRILYIASILENSRKVQHIIITLAKAIPGILNVFSILLLFFYIFSIIGVFLYKDTGIPEFQDVGMAMQTMFQVVTGDNWSDIMRAIEKTHPSAWAYFIIFYIIQAFIILNLFIGVVVGALQSAESELFPDIEEQEIYKMTIAMKKQLKRLEEKIDLLQPSTSLKQKSLRK